uniref:PLAT domain-containing protein n=1 Tax=Strongyloides papillosus TaxID=174720 RepID=A0A0N5CIW4_STREA
MAVDESYLIGHRIKLYDGQSLDFRCICHDWPPSKYMLANHEIFLRTYRDWLANISSSSILGVLSNLTTIGGLSGVPPVDYDTYFSITAISGVPPVDYDTYFSITAIIFCLGCQISLFIKISLQI